MSRYAEIDVAFVPADERTAIDLARRYAERILGLPPVEVRYFVASQDVRAGYSVSRPFEDEDGLLGFVTRRFPDRIHVRVGRPRLDLARTVLHEAEHLVQIRRANWSDPPPPPDSRAGQERAHRIGDELAFLLLTANDGSYRFWSGR